MKQPSVDATRVRPDALETFALQAARCVNIPEEHATLLARLLVINDLRGVLSHGTNQLLRYVHEIQSGGVNPQPDIRTLHETSTTLLITGDGGLGYFPAYDGTQRIIDKAREHGTAALVTRDHGHIGAAGIYTRLAAEHDLCAFATSGVQLGMEAGGAIHRAAGNPPMSFSAPSRDEPPLVLDCGVGTGLGRHADLPKTGKTAERLTGQIIRLLGLGMVGHAWGGVLTGMPVDPARAERAYHAAHQGALVYIFDPRAFTDLEQFKTEMDEYAREVRQLEPLEGTEGAFLPGGIEAQREKHYRAEGVPLGESHQQKLEKLAEELHLPLPWS